MFSTHVRQKFSAYFHEELSAEESRQVAEHLIGCTRCRLEFEQVKFGAKLAEQLPIAPAPDSLWPELEAALRDQPVGNAISARRPWLLEPRFAIAASFVLLLIGSILFLRFVRNEVGPSWQVARVEGTPRIGSTRIGDKGKLGVGQWLETDSSSRAQIDVASVGQVEIDPNTRVRLVATQPTEHRLELARGRMRARVWAPPKLFFVNTPSGVAEDLGCAYTLEVDDAGNSLLRVTTGWVLFQLKDRESMVPAGAACATRSGIGPGTPYFEDASESFRAALTKVDFESAATDKSQSLDSVLSEARVRDTLTLWHLLGRVDGNDRALVYERMANLTPPPDGVTREGILALNQQMLDTWKDKLESSWSDYSPSTMKALKK